MVAQVVPFTVAQPPRIPLVLLVFPAVIDPFAGKLKLTPSPTKFRMMPTGSAKVTPDPPLELSEIFP